MSVTDNHQDLESVGEPSCFSKEYWKGIFWPTLVDPDDEDDTISWPYVIINGIQYTLLVLFPHAFVPIIIFGVDGVLREEDGDLLEQMNFMVSSSIFMAGLCTVIQCIHLGPVGCQLLIVMGNNYAFVPVAILTGLRGGPGLVFGMAMASAPFEILLAYLPRKLFRRLFPPIVSGTVISLIAVTLSGSFLGMWANDGSSSSMGLGFFCIGLVTLFIRWGNVAIKNCAFFLTIFIGFGLAAIMGEADVTPMHKASWITYPRPLRYGLKFDGSLYLAWLVATIVSTIESIGDITSTAEMSKKVPHGRAHDNRIRGGLNGDAVGSFISGMFCALPNTTYSMQGVIKMTGVSDRRVGIVSGAFFLILGIIGKFAGFLMSIPIPVTASVLLIILFLLLTMGMELVQKADLSTLRTQFIVSTSLGIGLGTHVQTTPAVLYYVGYGSFLTDTANVIMQNGLAFGALTVIVLNLVLPEEPTSISGDLLSLRDFLLCRKQKREYKGHSTESNVQIDDLSDNYGNIFDDSSSDE